MNFTFSMQIKEGHISKVTNKLPKKKKEKKVPVIGDQSKVETSLSLWNKESIIIFPLRKVTSSQEIAFLILLALANLIIM